MKFLCVSSLPHFLTEEITCANHESSKLRSSKGRHVIPGVYTPHIYQLLPHVTHHRAAAKEHPSASSLQQLSKVKPPRLTTGVFLGGNPPGEMRYPTLGKGEPSSKVSW